MYPSVNAKHGDVSPVATGVAGVAIGAAVGAGIAMARKLGQQPTATKDGGEEK